MLTRSLFSFLLLLLFASCQSEKERLLSEGYQVFDAQKMALKCPCELKKKAAASGEQKVNQKEERWECTDPKTDVMYMIQFLPSKKTLTESEIADNTEQFVDLLKRDVQYIGVKKRKGQDVVSLRYTELFFGEVYVKPKMTYYINAGGYSAGQKCEELFSSVTFYE